MRDLNLNLKSAALGIAGVSLAFAAPGHRPDLLVLGVVALAASLAWWPWNGPALVALTLPWFFFSRQIAGPLGATPPVTVLALTWISVLVQRRRVGARAPRSPYDPLVALFLAAGLLSLLVTEYPLLSVRELRALILEPILFFLLLRTVPGSARLAVYAFVAAATITAAAAIAQVGLNLGGTAAEGVRRAQAWYPSANHLALMLGRAVPFALAAALTIDRRMWLPTGVLALGLLLTFSTGGWVGGLVAALIVLGALRGWALALRIGAAGAAALALVSGLAIAGALPERLNPLRQTGGFRLDLWQSSLDMLRDHPWLGVGLDNFVYLYQQIYLREGAAAEPNLSHPHNWILHVWLELGIVGLVAFCGLLIRASQYAWRNVIGSTAGRLPRAAVHGCPAWVVAGALGALTDMLVHGLIDNSYFLVDLAFLFWLCLAVIAESPHGASKPTLDQPTGRIEPT